jgi:hypothetical protein
MKLKVCTNYELEINSLNKFVIHLTISLPIKYWWKEVQNRTFNKQNSYDLFNYSYKKR